MVILNLVILRYSALSNGSVKVIYRCVYKKYVSVFFVSNFILNQVIKRFTVYINDFFKNRIF